MNTDKNTRSDLTGLGQTLLNIGTLLMKNGANTQRIRKTIARIAGEFDCKVELLITHRALVIDVSDDDQEHFHSAIKQSWPQGINFSIVSGISLMSWRVVQENWGISEINEEVRRILKTPQYPRPLIWLMISLAGASFCRLFDGTFLDMSVAFGATFCGLLVRQELTKRNFNPYMSVFFAALVASCVAGFFINTSVHIHDQAILASVLFLIPGVPLINSFSDLINGDIMNGIVRSVNGLIIAFSIALGFMLATQICQLEL